MYFATCTFTKNTVVCNIVNFRAEHLAFFTLFSTASFPGFAVECLETARRHYTFSLKLVTRAGIFKISMGARNRGGIGLSYRPASLHRLVKFIPWNQFRGPVNI
jgi:hypothetical protein